MLYNPHKLRGNSDVLTLLEFLNENTDAGDILFWGVIALCTWCLLWRLYIGEWLRKHEVSTFWYAMYEAGPLGTFGLALVGLLLLALLVTSLQAVSSYGPKVAAAAAFFWAVLIAVAVLIARSIKK